MGSNEEKNFSAFVQAAHLDAVNLAGSALGQIQVQDDTRDRLFPGIGTNPHSQQLYQLVDAAYQRAYSVDPPDTPVPQAFEVANPDVKLIYYCGNEGFVQRPTAQYPDRYLDTVGGIYYNVPDDEGYRAPCRRDGDKAVTAQGVTRGTMRRVFGIILCSDVLEREREPTIQQAVDENNELVDPRAWVMDLDDSTAATPFLHELFHATSFDISRWSGKSTSRSDILTSDATVFPQPRPDILREYMGYIWCRDIASEANGLNKAMRNIDNYVLFALSMLPKFASLMVDPVETADDFQCEVSAIAIGRMAMSFE